ncbi:DUF485 domain-containing protein [Streptomyces sp. WAC04114]|uniref:DUF485 domain-containing protein n=1 Tax=Streptomyces sp. WAC04114 TaxID=2867961 RepID=UPI001C8CBB8A|nr:DUF485 domain-containing protein [Streptomyces sp. WAC04114]MBX9364578.1 DUF485 domain-containing protein [Streptomyces sp. WAC04114]
MRRRPDFRSPRRAQRRFGIRATILSVGGFLLYVLLSSFVPAVMNQPLFGRLTLGLTLGLGQFAVMGVTAWCYVRHMRTRVDPLARGLRSRRYETESRRGRSAPPRQGAAQPLRPSPCAATTCPPRPAGQHRAGRADRLRRA